MNLYILLLYATYLLVLFSITLNVGFLKVYYLKVCIVFIKCKFFALTS